MDTRDNHSQFVSKLHAKLQNEKTSNALILQVGMSTDVNFESPCVNAKEIIPRIVDEIKSAEKEVLICGYKIDHDCDGEQELIKALQFLSEKAKQEGKNIRVRIIINRREGMAAHFRPNATTESKLREMEFDGLDYQYVEHGHGGFGSYHAKQFLIDNEVAILCSGDMTKRNNYKKGSNGFTEVATVIHSHDLVNIIRVDFISAWNSKNCNPINTHDEKKTIPDTATECEHSDHNNDPMEEELNPLPKRTPIAHRNKTNSDYINQEHVTAVYFAKAASTDVTRRNVSPYKIAVIEAIRSAKSQIDIMTPNLNDPDVIDELAKAVMRGIHVRIVIGKHMNDSTESKPYMGGTNYDNINILLEKISTGSHIDHYKHLDIHFVASQGKAIPEEHPNALHAKFICIDEAIVIAGSSVLDLQSIYHSREGDICFESPSVAKQYLDHLFNPVFNNGINYETDKILTMNEIIEESSNQYANTAKYLLGQKNYESAMKNLVEALKIYPVNKDAFFNLQMMLFQQDPYVIDQVSKNTLYNGIKQLGIHDQIRLLSECVNENSKTPLSCRMWKQEGIFPCSINSSTLKRMNKRLSKLTKTKLSVDATNAIQLRSGTRDSLFSPPLDTTPNDIDKTKPEIIQQKLNKK